MTVLGVAGHVDHGKTALVGALTGMATDRLAEEQARGISITLGFAHMQLGDRTIDLIDMPGHERFVRTMIAGAAGMDAILLVVDAREGVMPQTREHIDVAALLGITHAIVAVSRVDLACPADIAATARAATALVTQAGLAMAAALPVCARTGAGLDALRSAIAAVSRGGSAAADHGAPFLPVDRAFSRPGHGTVVTGTLRGGSLSVGDMVDIVPAGRAARIRGLQVHGQRVASASPGLRVAVNLRQIEPAQVARGTALAAPGALPPSAWLSVQLRTVSTAPPLATTQLVRVLLGTAETEARLRLLDRDVLLAGQSALAQLHCALPVAVPGRARIILRLPQVGTVGGGLVLDPCAWRARRRDPVVLARLADLATCDLAGIAAGEVARAGMAGVPLARLARLAGGSHARAASSLPDDATLLRDGQVVSAPALDALCAVLPRVVAPAAAGMARETLAAAVPRAGRAVLDAALGQLLEAGVLVRQGAAYRVPLAEHDDRAAREAAHRAARIAETLRRAGLTPPDLAEIAPDLASRRVMARLVGEGVVIRAPDQVQKREVFFHRDAIGAARATLAGLLTADGLLVGEIGAALGISRKFSVPLLEHLDATRFTRRLAERRVLAVAPPPRDPI